MTIYSERKLLFLQSRHPEREAECAGVGRPLRMTVQKGKVDR
jgi:hypothetical protein